MTDFRGIEPEHFAEQDLSPVAEFIYRQNIWYMKVAKFLKQ